MEYYSAIKKNKMPFAAIWMDLEIIRLSEVSLRKKDKYLMTLLISGTFKKNHGTNEPIYKTEIESQMQKTNLRLPKGKRQDTTGDGDRHIHTTKYKVDN